MEIIVSHAQGNVPVTVFHLKGSFRANEEIKELAQTEFDNGARYIVVDFSDVDFMGSKGLQGILAIYEMLRGDISEKEKQVIDQGISSGTYTSPHLKLLKPNELVKEVLNLTGYDIFLEVYENLEEVVNSF